MKKILVLGAAQPQTSLMKSAKKYEYEVICSSIKGKYPGFDIADRVYYADTRDCDGILQIAKKEGIDGILTTGTDVAVNSVAHVCERLGLQGASVESARLASDKALMKAAFAKSGVRTASFAIASSAAEAMDAAHSIEFPVMVKCVDKSGSRGITKVTQDNDIEIAFDNALHFSDKKYVVIEKCIHGKEIGVDGYIGDGVTFVAAYDRSVHNNGLSDIPLGHCLPLSCTKSIRDKISCEVLKAANALKLKHSFFNADLMISNDDVYIIEMGVRAGGVLIPELISAYYGFDFFKCMLENAVGRSPVFPSSPPCAELVCTSEILVSGESGIVSEIEIDEMIYDDDLVFLELDVNIGDYVSAFAKGADTYGGIITKGSTFEEANANLSRAKSCIKMKLI